MSWQDFMFAAVGLSALGLSGALVFTLSKIWPILDNVRAVSAEIRETGQLALRGPVGGVLRFINAITSRGGDRHG